LTFPGAHRNHQAAESLDLLDGRGVLGRRSAAVAHFDRPKSSNFKLGMSASLRQSGFPSLLGRASSDVPSGLLAATRRSGHFHIHDGPAQSLSTARVRPHFSGAWPPPPLTGFLRASTVATHFVMKRHGLRSRRKIGKNGGLFCIFTAVV
jgi:hypothetical protein